MSGEELMQLLRRRPFVPLRLHMTDGQTYDIRHPDNVLVLRSRVDIGVGADPATGVVAGVEYCSLLHVVRIEELQAATSPGNGEA
jgi:hypothetical protein